jgi:hypothetical protein
MEKWDGIENPFDKDVQRILEVQREDQAIRDGLKHRGAAAEDDLWEIDYLDNECGLDPYEYADREDFLEALQEAREESDGDEDEDEDDGDDGDPDETD